MLSFDAAYKRSHQNNISCQTEKAAFPSSKHFWPQLELKVVPRLTMFLAVGDLIRPVAGVRLLAVQQASHAELLRGGAVPARPVARAGGLVAKDAVQPVTVLRGYCRIAPQALFAGVIVLVVAHVH